MTSRSVLALTSDTLTMSSTPPPLATTQVAAEQYNALLARLDSEVLARTQLEANLVAAREQAAYLQRRLASLGQPDVRPPVRPDASAEPSVPAAPPAGACPAAKMPVAKHAPHPPSHPDVKPQDKEILSHCSDISGVRSPDTHTFSRAARRKSATNLAAMNINKKSKTKKERAPKVKIPGQSRYWTPEEHKLFLEALVKYGHKDLRAISAFVGTRNMTQVRTHSQKYFMRLMREARRQNPGNKGTEDASALVAAAAAKESAAVSSSNVKPPTGRSPAEASRSERGDSKEDSGDKYSVPNTCGMTLLCLVGQDTLPE